MALSFVTPLAAVVALAGLGAIAVRLLGERRADSLRGLLGLSPPPRSTRTPQIALLLVAGLLGLAAAQPVLQTQRGVKGRTDAEVLFVVDGSRSMNARANPAALSRLARAKRVAADIRAGLSGVPVGAASLTDRVVPYLFPTVSQNSFVSVVDRSVGIDRPPPSLPYGNARATDLGALSALASASLFGREAKRRAAVIFTDGESVRFDEATLADAFATSRVVTEFVHFWAREERVFERGGSINPHYLPDAGSEAALRTLARRLGGRLFAEHQADGVARAVRTALGRGKTGEHGRELQSVLLAPYAVAASLLPLLFLLWRRNLDGAGRPALAFRRGRDDGPLAPDGSR